MHAAYVLCPRWLAGIPEGTVPLSDAPHPLLRLPTLGTPGAGTSNLRISRSAPGRLGVRVDPHSVRPRGKALVVEVRLSSHSHCG